MSATTVAVAARRSRRVAVAAALLLAAVTFVGQASPAAASEPDPPCEWTPNRTGYDSTCDGKNMPDPPCEYFLPSLDYIVEIGDGVLVTLWYARGPSGQCRTVEASISVPFDLPAGSNCYVKVERNRRDPALGDNDRIYAGIQPGQDFAITADLYDAGVSSYAWGYCARPGHPTVRGGTPSY